MIAVALAGTAGGAPSQSFEFGREPGFALPPSPVIVVYVDGLHAGILEEERAAGRFPALARYLLDRAARVENAVTCIPSVTYANASSMVTSILPGGHGILNRWFDRVHEEGGGHGGIERDEMIIPFLVAGPGIVPGHVIPSARLVDLVPTVLDLMGHRSPREGGPAFDGQSLAARLRR